MNQQSCFSPCQLLGLFVALCLAPIASGQEPTKTKPPNILFAIADDWSYGHASAYGCKWVETPAFDRIAREGILFDRAYTPNAKCAPSRSCIVTGRNSWQLKEGANHIAFFPPEFKSYSEALADHGWFVGFTGKGWGPGVAQDANGKPRQMTGRPFQSKKAPPPTRAISNNDYAANFAEFHAAVPDDTPWCFWYGTTEPHRAYEYGSGVRAGKKPTDIEHVPAFWPDNETVRNDMLDYAVEVEHFDTHLGRILKHLEEAGELENTLIVATSDHGMPFPRCKGQAYEYSNHVPLAICWPAGIKGKGRKVDDYVSFIDFVPTFLEVAQLQFDEAGMESSPGRSLTDIFAVAASGQINAERDHVLIGKERHDIGRPHDWGYPIRGIVKNDLLYIHNYETDRWPAGNPETGYLNCDAGATKTQVLQLRTVPDQDQFWNLCFGKRPADEFYDLKADNDCVANLVGSEQHADAMQQLKLQMERELKAQDDPRMFGRGEFFDKVPYANAGTRNFYERYMKGEKLNAGWVDKSDFEEHPLD